jgi:hypothetical protein
VTLPAKRNHVKDLISQPGCVTPAFQVMNL